jgi:hypothetical protein
MKYGLSSFVSLLALGATLLAFNVAQAHGSGKPEHGGVVQITGETVLELVTNANGVELYIEEEDEEISSAGMSAKLTLVGADGAKSEVTLTPASGNKLEAKGVKIPSGSKVAVLLTLADQQSKVGANFIVK